MEAAPRSVDVLYYLGLAAAQAGNTTRAVAAFRRARKLDPDFADIHLNLGMAYYDLGLDGQARKAFEQTLALDAENGAAMFFMALMQRDAGETAAAAALFQRAAEADSDFAQLGHYQAGLAYQRLDRPQEARAALRQAIDADPDSETAAEARARLREMSATARTRRAWSLSASAGLQYDDNVTIDEVDQTSEVGARLCCWGCPRATGCRWARRGPWRRATTSRSPTIAISANSIPAYPRHSACGDTCSQYVLYEGVTVMGFKVASRVRGLSDEAFREAFGTKEQCRAALVRLRWPGGFVCPCCGHREHCVLAGRGLYQCNRCKKQTSPTAGTIFHATKLPLTLWFAAIHLIVTAKNGISSVELGRRLGVKQPTAWAVKHKIMAVMARREGETALTGRVEMDDAYLGGVRSGGKRGRGAAGKTPFVAAVSTSPEGRPRKLKLAPVKGFRKREIARGAKHWLAPGAAVVTDGLGCWSALDEAACSHQAIRTGSGRQAARMASFKSVNTTLGNIKSAITGTYRKLGPDHAGRYLASFAWRYNRRYQLQTMDPAFRP